MNHLQSYYSFFAIEAFQLLFILCLAIGSRKKDYGMYAVYLLSVLVYSTGLCENYYKIHLVGIDAPFFHLLLDKPMVFFSYMLYFRFGRYFLDTAEINVSFDRLVRRFEVALLVFTIAQVLFLRYATPAVAELVFQLLSFVVIPFSLYAVVRFIRLQKTKLNYFFIVGVASVLLGSLGNFTVISLQNAGILDTRFPAPLLFQCSVIIESLAFTLGLVYKLLYIEKEKNSLQEKLIRELNRSFEAERTLNEYTTGLSQSLHDHVGASFTNISLLSRVPAQYDIEKIRKNNTLIGQIANDSIAELKETMWLIRREERYGLDTIIEKLRGQYAASFSGKSMEFAIGRSWNLDNAHLSVVQEKHLFFIAKEAITNALKYSNGSLFRIWFEKEETTFGMSVTEDGTCTQDVSFFFGKGNGLAHLHDRARQLNATIDFPQPRQFSFHLRFELYDAEKDQHI